MLWFGNVNDDMMIAVYVVVVEVEVDGGDMVCIMLWQSMISSPMFDILCHFDLIYTFTAPNTISKYLIIDY